MRSASLPQLGLFGGALSLLGAGCCDLAAPAYVGVPSDHFDGRHFHNQGSVQAGGWTDLVRWKLDDKPGPWDAWSDAQPGPRPPSHAEPLGLRVTFVNHATLLVQLDTLNILTDPIWSERASPVSWAGPKRVRPPGIRFEDLPHIDIVLISHDHYDHLDLPTLERLASTHQPRIIVPLGNRGLLAERQIQRVEELDWWESAKIPGGGSIWAVPAQHFSQRGVCDRDATLWAGFVIQRAQSTVYFAGDTGFGPHFAQIRERFGAPRLAILPIGAFEPSWFMKPIHLNPEEALEAHRLLGAQASVAMHFGTFQLADDGQREAPERLLAAVTKAGDTVPPFWVLGFGEGRDEPHPPQLAEDAGQLPDQDAQPPVAAPNAPDAQ